MLGREQGIGSISAECCMFKKKKKKRKFIPIKAKPWSGKLCVPWDHFSTAL